MPIATIDPNQFARYELKSAPPDGYVMLRPLPYGMVLERQDNTLLMQMKGRRPQDRKRKGQSELPDIDLKNLNAAATEYDFKYCIGEHNLTDVNGALLDFGNPLVFKVLDPRVAQEISGYIDELNNPDDAESAEDFINRVTSSRGEDQTSRPPLPMEGSSTEPQLMERQN